MWFYRWYFPALPVSGGIPLPRGELQDPANIRLLDAAGREVPVRWRVELPGKGVDISTTPLNRQSWMATLFPYWEGPIRFTGTMSGKGYLEMTGYQ